MNTQSRAISIQSSLWLATMFIFLAAEVLGFHAWDGRRNVLLESSSFIRESERMLQGANQILQGANAELARILSVMSDLREGGLKVVFGRKEYPMAAALPYARQYLRMHYQGEDAESWVRKHLYQALGRGETIYLKYPDGTTELLRDVFLDKLSES